MHVPTVTLAGWAAHEELEHGKSHVWNRIQAPLDNATIEVGGKVGEGFVEVGSKGSHCEAGLRARVDQLPVSDVPQGLRRVIASARQQPWDLS